MRSREGSELGVHRVLLEHGHQLDLLELGPPLGEMAHFVAHGLQVAAGRAGGGVHALLDGAAPLADAGDLLLEALLGGGQRSPAAVGVGPLGLQRGQLGLDRGEARRLGQAVASVLQLGEGSVEVLHREEVVEDVGHRSSSEAASARASGSASASAASAMAMASSQVNQRASGLSPGGGAGSASAPSSRYRRSRCV